MNFDSVYERMERLSKDPEYQAEQAKKAAREAAEVVRRIGDCIVATGIPLVFRELVKAGMDETPAVLEANGVGTGVVVLSGKPGCGKTAAACNWIASAFTPETVDQYQGYRGRNPPLFVTSARLSRWDRYDNERMDALLKADRLVIDDVGAEFADAKGNFNAILDELVSDRHGNRRPLIITTNLDAAAFKLRYDERIADRIRQVGRFVSLDGGSLRKRKDAA